MTGRFTPVRQSATQRDNSNQGFQLTPPLLTINLMDPAQRRFARTILDAADANEAIATVPVPTTGTEAETPVPATQVRKLRKLLRLSSGELLTLAVKHYGPDEQFDVKELAQRSGEDVDTLLSKNRTLANSCKKRGMEKGLFLQEHNGQPKKFSVPAAIHARIASINAQSVAIANPQPNNEGEFVFLCNAQWADPEEMTDNRVMHVPVHVYRNRTTRQLHVILFEDDKLNPAPTYIVEENELILPPGGLPG
jgi:hypothetical protein